MGFLLRLTSPHVGPALLVMPAQVLQGILHCPAVGLVVSTDFLHQVRLCKACGMPAPDPLSMATLQPWLRARL